MKQLQNNFTTPEQSKKLLELGIPADSADCYFDSRNIRRLRSEDWMLKQNFFIEYSYFTPCWSVGRLIEIIDIISSCSLTPQFCENYTESLVEELESMVCNNKFDFSKLED